MAVKVKVRKALPRGVKTSYDTVVNTPKIVVPPRSSSKTVWIILTLVLALLLIAGIVLLVLNRQQIAGQAIGASPTKAVSKTLVQQETKTAIAEALKPKGDLLVEFKLTSAPEGERFDEKVKWVAIYLSSPDKNKKDINGQGGFVIQASSPSLEFSIGGVKLEKLFSDFKFELINLQTAGFYRGTVGGAVGEGESSIITIPAGNPTLFGKVKVVDIGQGVQTDLQLSLRPNLYNLYHDTIAYNMYNKPFKLCLPGFKEGGCTVLPLEIEEAKLPPESEDQKPVEQIFPSPGNVLVQLSLIPLLPGVTSSTNEKGKEVRWIQIDLTPSSSQGIYHKQGMIGFSSSDPKLIFTRGGGNLGGFVPALDGFKIEASVPGVAHLKPTMLVPDNIFPLGKKTKLGMVEVEDNSNGVPTTIEITLLEGVVEGLSFGLYDGKNIPYDLYMIQPLKLCLPEFTVGVCHNVTPLSGSGSGSSNQPNENPLGSSPGAVPDSPLLEKETMDGKPCQDYVNQLPPANIAAATSILAIMNTKGLSEQQTISDISNALVNWFNDKLPALPIDPATPICNGAKTLNLVSEKEFVYFDQIVSIMQKDEEDVFKISEIFSVLDLWSMSEEMQ